MKLNKKNRAISACTFRTWNRLNFTLALYTEEETKISEKWIEQWTGEGAYVLCESALASIRFFLDFTDSVTIM